jgi:hypothetical protein
MAKTEKVDYENSFCEGKYGAHPLKEMYLRIQLAKMGLTDDHYRTFYECWAEYKTPIALALCTLAFLVTGTATNSWTWGFIALGMTLIMFKLFATKIVHRRIRKEYEKARMMHGDLKL